MSVTNNSTLGLSVVCGWKNDWIQGDGGDVGIPPAFILPPSPNSANHNMAYEIFWEPGA